MDLEQIKKRAFAEIYETPDRQSLEKIRIRYLGRRAGEVTAILRSLINLPFTERRRVGSEANQLKRELEKALAEQLNKLRTKEPSPLDLTAPGKKISAGHLHPLTQVEKEIREIFLGLNFSVVEGPEIETEHYNFDALNIPVNHPARDAWNTFWLKDGRLLRTHTSPAQIKYMEHHKPPFQIIVPGRVFRYEATDNSHEINFYQIEGLMVGQDISLANFKFIITEFFRRLFQKEIPLRLRPSYFPFVEPGLEVDIGQNGEWLEVMGAGMVHPKVFDAVRYNPQEWQGFAFGLGLERLTMIKYKIPDIRLFYNGDLRFLNQF